MKQVIYFPVLLKMLENKKNNNCPKLVIEKIDFVFCYNSLMNNSKNMKFLPEIYV